MSYVLDASALLARLNHETGADRVEQALLDGACCGTANWSETVQKILSQRQSPIVARGLLDSYGLRFEPVTVEDAQRAAERWRPGESFSLADRLCMALGERLDAQVLTADRAWGTEGRIVQIR